MSDLFTKPKTGKLSPTRKSVFSIVSQQTRENAQIAEAMRQVQWKAALRGSKGERAA